MAAFSASVSSVYSVHKTTLETLYHSPIHAKGTRDQILADVARRNIDFPDFLDIKVPIRSTFSGEILNQEISSGSLVESVVDMVVTQPVNWDLVVNKLVRLSPADVSVRLLNVGPGTGLTRSLERAFPPERVSSLDLTVLNTKTTQQSAPKQEPIAIVGMAVNMPGASNTSKLWELLEQGINTISEVNISSIPLLLI